MVQATVTREQAVRLVTNQWGGERFSWGVMDCCQLARQVFIAYKGYDPAQHLPYESEKEALALIQRHGGLRGLLTEILGSPSQVDETNTADVLLLKLPTIGEIVGVRVPDGALVPLKVGLYKAPLRYALEGWRI